MFHWKNSSRHAAARLLRFDHLPGRVSTREHLERELQIVPDRQGRASVIVILVWEPKPFDPKLDEEQREALATMFSNRNRVSVFRGGAGTGKSFVLRELVGQIRDGGRGVVVLAPQRQQVLDMERDGFPAPATVASFLARRELGSRCHRHYGRGRSAWWQDPCWS